MTFSPNRKLPNYPCYISLCLALRRNGLPQHPLNYYPVILFELERLLPHDNFERMTIHDIGWDAVHERGTGGKWRDAGVELPRCGIIPAADFEGTGKGHAVVTVKAPLNGGHSYNVAENEHL